MIKQALLALMLAAAGCSVAQEPAPALDAAPVAVVAPEEAPVIERIELTVDAESLTADEQEAVIEAIADWQALAGGRFELTAVIGDASAHGWNDIYGATAEELAEFLPEGSPAHAHVYGFTSHENGVRLLKGMSTHRMRSVAAHEVGHRLGLDHSTDDTAVMWPIYRSDVSGPTASDAEALAQEFGAAP